MWELDCKESQAPKNWFFWIMVLENTLESPLDCEEMQPVHPKGDQSWVFIGRTDTEAETSILWPRDEKNRLIWIAPDAGWGRLKAGGEGDNIGWNGWVASPPQWTWVWVNSRSWWWTGMAMTQLSETLPSIFPETGSLWKLFSIYKIYIFIHIFLYIK